MPSASSSFKKYFQADRLLTLIASVLTIANFLWTLTGSTISTVDFQSLTKSPINSLALGVIVFFILEFILAYAFSKAIDFIEDDWLNSEEFLGFFPSFVILLISGWTSIFNWQWFVIGPYQSSKGDYFAMFMLGVVLTSFIGALMISIRRNHDIYVLVMLQILHLIPFSIIGVCVAYS